MVTKTKARSSRAAKVKTDYTSPARLNKIFAALDELFPLATCALTHDNPFQLLVATILSAQCTDERVNKVTPELFKRFPDSLALSHAEAEELERLIHSTGFYKNKAKSLLGCAQKLVVDYQGEVPNKMDELITLPGVGRKTANVV